MIKIKELKREEFTSLEGPFRDKKLATLTMSKLDELHKRIKSSSEFDEKLRHEMIDFYTFLLNEKIMMLCDYVFFTKINDRWKAIVYDTGLIFPSDIFDFEFQAGNVPNKMASGGAFGRYVYDWSVKPDISMDSVGIIFSIKIGPKPDENEDNNQGGIEVFPVIDYSKVGEYDLNDALDRYLWEKREFTYGEAFERAADAIGFDYMKLLNTGWDSIKDEFRLKFQKQKIDPIETDEPDPGQSNEPEQNQEESVNVETIIHTSWEDLQKYLEELEKTENQETGEDNQGTSEGQENAHYFKLPFGGMAGRLPGII